MARIAKFKDQANWRKGKDLQVGDMIATNSDGKVATEFSAIASFEGMVPYMGVSNYKFTLENGMVKFYGGGEFAHGQY